VASREEQHKMFLSQASRHFLAGPVADTSHISCQLPIACHTVAQSL
jgi:hypothetical protein